MILTSRLPDVLDDESRAHAAAICEQLGHLSLALSQISGYLEASGCSFGDFLPTYREVENLPELYAATNPGSTTLYRHNLSTVWTMTMASLQNKSTTGIRTLGVLAFLDPDGTPACLTLCLQNLAD